MRLISVPNGPSAYLKNGVIRYKDRNIVVVVTPDKRQPFYQSTGRNSGMPKEWFPFDGIKFPDSAGEWFDKRAYVFDPKEPWNKYGFGKLYRYGTQYLFEISQALKTMNIPDGLKVESGMDVNLFLGVLDKYATDSYRQTWTRNKSWRLCNLPNVRT